MLAPKRQELSPEQFDELPPTTADWPKMSGLVLDMKKLGETPTSQIESKLRPLITAYDAWIKDRQADLKKPDMALYQKPGEKEIPHEPN